MDTRKVTFIATIAAIILVAVGIGYAYTAMTTNTENNASPEYVTIMQGGDGAYQFSDGTTKNIYWDTEDKKSATAGKHDTVFKLSKETDTTTVSGYTLVQVGDPITLKTAIEVPTGAVLADLTATITCTAGTFAGPFVGTTGESALFIGITADEEVDQLFKVTADNTFQKYVTSSFSGDNTFTIFEDTSSYKDAVVTVYYGYAGTDGITVTEDIGTAATGPEDKPITDATVKFTVSTASGNGDYVYRTGLAVSSTSVSASATTTVDVTVTNLSPAMICTSSNTDVATVSYAEGTGVLTITKVAAGHALVIVESVEGGFQKVIDVTFT